MNPIQKDSNQFGGYFSSLVTRLRKIGGPLTKNFASSKRMVAVVAIGCASIFAPAPSITPVAFGAPVQTVQKSESDLQSEIEEAFKAEQYQTVVQKILVLEKDNPQKFSQNLHTLGYSYFQLGQWKKSEEAYQKYLSTQFSETQLKSKDLVGDLSTKWKDRLGIARSDRARALANYAFQQRKTNPLNYTNQQYLTDLNTALQAADELADVKLPPLMKSDIDYTRLDIIGAKVFELNQPIVFKDFASQLMAFSSANPNHPNRVWIDFLAVRSLMADDQNAEVEKLFNRLKTDPVAQKSPVFAAILDQHSAHCMRMAARIDENPNGAKSPQVIESLKDQTAAYAESSWQSLQQIRKDYANYQPIKITLDQVQNRILSMDHSQAKSLLESAQKLIDQNLANKESTYNFHRYLILLSEYQSATGSPKDALATSIQLLNAITNTKDLDNRSLPFAGQIVLPITTQLAKENRWKEVGDVTDVWLKKFSKQFRPQLVQWIDLQNAVANSKQSATLGFEPSIKELTRISSAADHSQQLGASWELALIYQQLAYNWRDKIYTQLDPLSIEENKAATVAVTRLNEIATSLEKFDFFTGDLTGSKSEQFQFVKTWKAESFLILGNFQQADSELENLIASFPKSKLRHRWKLARAMALLDPHPAHQETPEKTATEVQTKLLTADSISGQESPQEKALAQYYLGRSLFRMATVKQSVQAFKKSAELYPNWKFGIHAKKLALQGISATKDWKQYQDLAEQFANSTPASQGYRFEIEQAYALFMQKDYKSALAKLSSISGAVDGLEVSLTKSSLQSDLLWWKAECYRQLNDAKNAKLAYQDLQKSFPGYTRNQQIPTEFLLAGSVPKSNDQMKETGGRKVEKVLPLTLYSDATSAIEKKNWVEAEKLLAELVDRFPADKDSDRFQFHLGWVQWKQQKTTEALENLQKVLKVKDSPWADQSQFFVASIQAAQNKFEEAEAGFLAVASSSSDPELKSRASYNYGLVLQKKESWNEAALAFEKVAKDFPKSSILDSALLHAAICYEKNEQSELAGKTLERISGSLEDKESLELSNEECLLAANLAAKTGSWKVVSTLLDQVKLADIAENHRDDFRFQKGIAHYQQKNWEKAIDSFKGNLSVANAIGAQSLYYTAVCLEQNAQKTQAIDHYKKLVYGAYGENPPATVRKLTAMAKYEVGRIVLELMASETNSLLKQEYKQEAIRWFAKATVQSDDLDVRSKAKDQLNLLR